MILIFSEKKVVHGKFYASIALATHDQSLSREASFQKKLLFIVPAAAREYMRSLVLALIRREILGNDLKHFLIHISAEYPLN